MSKKTQLRSIRKFSVEFKKAIVREFENGNFSISELCKLHDLHNTNVYQWVYQYSTKGKPKTTIVEMKKSSTQKLKDYEKKVKDLHAKVGEQQILIDYLNAIIEAASEHYGEDLKKNLNIQELKK